MTYHSLRNLKHFKKSIKQEGIYTGAKKRNYGSKRRINSSAYADTPSE